jgi:transcription antitermination factor NusG
MSGVAFDTSIAPAKYAIARWYVIETKQHRESVAQQLLRRKGVRTYLPLLQSWPAEADAPRVEPLFPSYLFVHSSLPDEFATVAWTPGVKRFIPIAAEPIAVDDVVVEYLKSQEDAAGVVRAPERIVPHGEVVVVVGPLRGMTGIVERSLPARERVRILIELMHRPTSVELPKHWLRPS